MPMLSAKYAAMTSQSMMVSCMAHQLGGLEDLRQVSVGHWLPSSTPCRGLKPLTHQGSPSKLLPDWRIVMSTTQRPTVTLTLTERAGEEVKKFLAEEKVA